MATLPWARILWPSFLAASALEMLVFALVDPAELRWTHEPHLWSVLGVYSVAFFLFWIFAIVSSAVTAYLLRNTTESEGTN